MNVVMTKSGKFIEIQGTAEGSAFSKEELDALLEVAKDSLDIVFERQEAVL